jgi:hypothetical protein
LSATRGALAEKGPPAGCIDVSHEDRILLKGECVSGQRERPETPVRARERAKRLDRRLAVKRVVCVRDVERMSRATAPARLPSAIFFSYQSLRPHT